MTINWKKAEKSPDKKQKIECGILMELRDQIYTLVNEILENNEDIIVQSEESDDEFNNLEENNQKFVENLPIDWKLIEENLSKSYKIENRFLLLISSQINELKRILNSIKTQS